MIQSAEGETRLSQEVERSPAVAIEDQGIQKSSFLRRHKYIIVAIISYVIGLILTGVAAVLLASGQPALLFLVPSLLLGVLITALLSKELLAFYNFV